MQLITVLADRSALVHFSLVINTRRSYAINGNERRPRVNGEIRARSVRLVDSQGQLGVVPLSEALKRAEEANLDLVEICPQDRPPVCKMLDYGKYRFDEKKKAQQQVKQPKLKEAQLSPNIAPHDLETKLRQVRDWMATGHKVKIDMMFKGRQNKHPGDGMAVMREIAVRMGDLAKVERGPLPQGKHVLLFLAPKD